MVHVYLSAWNPLHLWFSSSPVNAPHGWGAQMLHRTAAWGGPGRQEGVEGLQEHPPEECCRPRGWHSRCGLMAAWPWT